MRTACSLSSAADDFFFWEENTAESEKNERGEVMSGSPTHQKQLQHAARWSPFTATADPRLPTTQRSAYKRLQHVSERGDRNQRRLAGYNLISRRRRRRLRSEWATPQPTDILTLYLLGTNKTKIFPGLFGGSLGFSSMLRSASLPALVEHASTGTLTNPALLAPSSIWSKTKLKNSDNSSST